MRACKWTIGGGKLRSRAGSEEKAMEGPKEQGAETGIWKKPGSISGGSDEASESGSDRKSGTSRSESSDSSMVERTLAVAMQGMLPAIMFFMCCEPSVDWSQ